MPHAADQILTATQMRAAEQALIAVGSSVDELMQRAGCGAADWIWRLAGGGKVTVLCGPGNNGGDGYVIAEALRRRGGAVQVVAAADPASAACQAARACYAEAALGSRADVSGDVLVDCLFGTGLTRPLTPDHTALLARLAASHRQVVAVDLPSGVDADTGQPLNPNLPANDLTLALGAWKPAHFLMPAAARMGALRLVEIGVDIMPGAAQLIDRPRFAAPAASAHKYTRGLLGVVGGAMPGAAVLAAMAAQGAGAGYFKLLGEGQALAPDLVHDPRSLAEALTDKRFNALLIGPGLGRDDAARAALALTLAKQVSTVLDADALVLLTPALLAARSAPLIATPHEGELALLEAAFALSGAGSKIARAAALAKASGMMVVAKGADTVVAAPGGQIALVSRASSWLSTAGTGDVLAGIVASRLAAGAEPFAAASQGVWLHGEAARCCPAPFTASQLAARVPSAYAACL